ncbi:MAG: adenylate/guanylate cyclase domain-containing protein [Vulcanimicrobiota bacterium]
MSFQKRLILISAALGVLLSFILPVFTRLEQTSYDSRLVRARGVRGNPAPSQAAQFFAFTEETRDKLPEWSVQEERELLKLLKNAPAKDIWLDPNLSFSQLDSELSEPPLPPISDSDGRVRRVALAEGGRLSPELRLYASWKGVPHETIRVESKRVVVGEEVLPRVLAVDFPPNQAGQSAGSISRRFLEPVSLHVLFDGGTIASQDHQMVQKLVKDSLVLVGEYTQTARTRFDTPVGSLEHHQVVYAALDTLLSGWRLWEPPFILSILTTLALCVLAARLTILSPSFFRTTVGWAVLSYGYWVSGEYLFARGLYLPFVPPLMATILTIVLVAGVLQWRAFQMLKQLVGDERAGDAARGEIELGGTERNVTILFTNLPKAIQELEQVDPEESIRARNRYCAHLTKGVRGNGGRVLDYQGDYQMAGFCVERVDPMHALNAVKAGLELCQILSSEYPDESIHCGVCTGPAAVGYVGAPSAKELAAIGDTTNVAARLLGAAQKQGVPVLISEPTYLLCSEQLVAEKLPAVSLKGKTSVVEVYQVESIVE